jgi:predicted phosphodiesterase
MKRCILTDTHSRDPRPFIEKMSSCFDSWAFLGDYDNPEVLNYLRTMPGDNIVIVGNHEYDFAMGRVPDSSYILFREKILEKLWENADEEKEFVLDCIEDVDGERCGVRVIRGDAGRRVAYAHSNIGLRTWSNLSERLCRPNKPLGFMEDAFRNLVNKGVGIMLRGHDHVSRIFSIDGEGSDFREGKIRREEIFLDPNRRYIISVGAFVDGKYAVYDEGKQSVSFCSV